MNAEELLAAAGDMESTTSRTWSATCPKRSPLQLVKSMDAQDRERLNTVLSPEPDTAGGLMNTDTVSVRADVTVEVVLRYLRMRGELPDKTDRLFVVDRVDSYLGTVALTRLITDDPEKPVGEIIDPEAPRIAPETPCQRRGPALPGPRSGVRRRSDDDGKLLGRITVDDVVDVIREEAAHEVMSAAGLRDEEDVFAGVFHRPAAGWCGSASIWPRRLLRRRWWPVPRDDRKGCRARRADADRGLMGGIAGTQTVTLIVRGIALGQVEWVNAKWLLWKEIAVGGLNGLLWALVVGAVTSCGSASGRSRPSSPPRCWSTCWRRTVGVIVPLRCDAAHRPGALGRRNPDHLHRLHRLRHFVRLGRAVPDLKADSMADLNAVPCSRAASHVSRAPFLRHDGHPASRAGRAQGERQQVFFGRLVLPETPVRRVVRGERHPDDLVLVVE